MHTVLWKNEKIRQINYLVILLFSTVWKSTIKRDQTKKFREINSFVTFLVKTSISRKNVGFFRKIRDCVL